jgi:hypothetical protein
MATSQSRKARGMRTQKVVAEWFARHGFPHAETTGSGRSGVDVLGMPGLSPEVKARRDLSLPSWLRQATKNGNGGVPFVVHRPDGFGETTIGDWPVTMRLEDFTALVRAAGYGDPEPDWQAVAEAILGPDGLKIEEIGDTAA